MCKGNDIQGKVTGSRSDRTDEPGETGSVEAQAEERGEGRMKKTSDNTWFHKGWYIEYCGNGYRLTRRESVNGETIVKTAGSLEKAKCIIDNAELEIKTLGHVVVRRK